MQSVADCYRGWDDAGLADGRKVDHSSGCMALACSYAPDRPTGYLHLAPFSSYLLPPVAE